MISSNDTSDAVPTTTTEAAQQSVVQLHDASCCGSGTASELAATCPAN